MKKNNEKGSSMVEVLGVLAFLGTISGAAYSLVSDARSKIQITREYGHTKRVIKAMREQFAAFRPVETSSATLYKLGVFDNVALKICRICRRSDGKIRDGACWTCLSCDLGKRDV